MQSGFHVPPKKRPYKEFIFDPPLSPPAKIPTFIPELDSSPFVPLCADDLPDALLMQVFAYLSPHELWHFVRLVCRRWRLVVLNMAVTWRRIFISPLSSWSGLWARVSCHTNSQQQQARYLSMEAEWLTCEQLTQLLSVLPHIRCISLCRQRLDEELLVAIFTYNNQTSPVRHLSVSCLESPEDVTRLISPLQHLTRLDLTACDVLNNKSLEIVSESHSEMLRCLWVKANGLTNTAIRYIRRFKFLESLVLKWANRMSARGLCELFNPLASQLHRLQELRVLHSLNFNDLCVETMCQFSGESLQVLVLWDTPRVTDLGLQRIADKGLGALQELCLADNDFISLEPLRQVHLQLPNLRRVFVLSCGSADPRVMNLPILGGSQTFGAVRVVVGDVLDLDEFPQNVFCHHIGPRPS